MLEISKTFMYDYHYNVMYYYGDKIELVYIDTDKWIQTKLIFIY